MNKRKYPRGRKGCPKHMRALKKSKHMQRWLLQNPWMRPLVAFNIAAIKIQALVRGVIVRLAGKIWKSGVKYSHEALSRRKSKKTKGRQLDKYLGYMDYFSKNTTRKLKPKWLDEGFGTWCAVRIQSWWRMIRVWRKKIYNSALEIQSCWRKILQQREDIQKTAELEIRATNRSEFGIHNYARRIQYCWRSFCNTRVFKYFRDLVRVKLRGIPSDILKAIIPNESDLLDKAAGVHVRFRLGGMIFPPRIYYKVYTHRPVCDVNAFAPRDYATDQPISAASKHCHLPKVLSNKELQGDSRSNRSKVAVLGGIGDRDRNRKDRDGLMSVSVSVTPMSGIKTNSTNANASVETIRVGKRHYVTVMSEVYSNTSNWYQKLDYNGWRQISPSFDEYFPPPWVRVSKKGEDHNTYGKNKAENKNKTYRMLRFKNDIIRQRKQRKREWMMKAYLFSSADKCNDFHSIDSRQEKDLLKCSNSRSNSNKDDEIYENENEENASQENVIDVKDMDGMDMHVDEVMYHGGVLLPHFAGSGNNYARRVGGERSERKQQYQSSKQTGGDEELLKWSMALDFDQYLKEWQGIATTLPSDITYDTIYEVNG